MGRTGLTVLKTWPSDTVFSVSVQGKDNIRAEICHRRWTGNLREKERVLHLCYMGRENMFILCWALSQLQSPCIISEIERASLDLSQPTVSGHYVPYSQLWTNSTSFSFSCSVTIQGQAPGCLPTQGPPKFKICASHVHVLCPKVGHGPTCCSPNFQFSKDTHSWFSKTNITSHKGHATELSGSYMFFCTYSTLNVFRKYYNWNTSGLT